MNATVATRAPAPPAELEQVDFLDLLDEDGCEDWVLRVLMLRRYWRRRHALAPFFTLGLAAYLDGAALPGGRYLDDTLRRENNALIDTHFAPLLRAVASSLSMHFGMPAGLADEAARPGFHIYLPHPTFGLPVASIHRDRQYRDVFPELTPAAADVFTFTLPLSTPPGSGLNIWRSEDGEAAFVPYRSGQLVVHDGLATHQAVLACDGALERITLQGHGIKTAELGILLYW